MISCVKTKSSGNRSKFIGFFFFLKKKKSRQMLDSIQRDKKWALKRIYRILLGFILLFHALKNMAVFIYSTHKSIYIVIVTTFFLFFIVMTT
jgi:hypothetical protein